MDGLTHYLKADEQETVPSLLTPGHQTTEYKQAKSGSAWGIITMLLGFIGSGAGVFSNLSEMNKTVLIIAGAAVVIVGLLCKRASDVAYINVRGDVKTAHLDAISKNPTIAMLLCVALLFPFFVSGCFKRPPEGDRAQQVKIKALNKYVENTNAVHRAEQEAYRIEAKAHITTKFKQGLEQLKREHSGADGKVDAALATRFVTQMLEEKELSEAMVENHVKAIQAQIEVVDRDMYTALKLDQLVERFNEAGIDPDIIQSAVDAVTELVSDVTSGAAKKPKVKSVPLRAEVVPLEAP